MVWIGSTGRVGPSSFCVHFSPPPDGRRTEPARPGSGLLGRYDSRAGRHRSACSGRNFAAKRGPSQKQKSENEFATTCILSQPELAESSGQRCAVLRKVFECCLHGPACHQSDALRWPLNKRGQLKLAPILKVGPWLTHKTLIKVSAAKLFYSSF